EGGKRPCSRAVRRCVVELRRAQHGEVPQRRPVRGAGGASPPPARSTSTCRSPCRDEHGGLPRPRQANGTRSRAGHDARPHRSLAIGDRAGACCSASALGPPTRRPHRRMPPGEPPGPPARQPHRRLRLGGQTGACGSLSPGRPGRARPDATRRDRHLQRRSAPALRTGRSPIPSSGMTPMTVRCRTLGSATALLAALFSAAPPAHAQTAESEYQGAAALGLALRRLGNTARVLVIAAHPDDENTPLLSALALGSGADVAYLSLTRGEGGQNAIGPELQEALGLLRSEELLAARRLDGPAQFF